MSFDTLLYNLDLTKQVKEYLDKCIKENDFDYFQEPCVVRIYSGNPFRISDNTYYIDVKDASVIIAKLKAVNKNINWNTMPGILVRLKKWKIASDYDEVHDKLKFDIVVDDADYLEKIEPSHQNELEITSLLESDEFKNKFNMLKKHIMSERFEVQHPIENALSLLEIGKIPEELDEVEMIEEPFMPSSLNKFPSQFSFTNQNFGGEDYSTSPNKYDGKRSYGQALEVETQNDLRLGELLVKMDGEAARKESIRKRSEQIIKLKNQIEALTRSKKTTPVKTPIKNIPFPAKPLEIARVSNTKIRELMRSAGPKSILNKRTPQPDDFEGEIYYDISGDEGELEVENEGELDDEDYFKSFKKITLDNLRPKPKSSLKKSPLKKLIEPLKGSNSKIFQRFTEVDRGVKLLSNHPKDLFRREIVNPINKKVKIDLRDFKPMDWKMASSSRY